MRDWLEDAAPDVAVMIYNDHGLEFFLDKQPTFAVGVAPEYYNQDEGWGLPTIAPFKGAPELLWHIIKALIGDEFDLVTYQEMNVGHGFAIPMQLFWPNYAERDLRTVSVMINTVPPPRLPHGPWGRHWAWRAGPGLISCARSNVDSRRF